MKYSFNVSKMKNCIRLILICEIILCCVNVVKLEEVLEEGRKLVDKEELTKLQWNQSYNKTDIVPNNAISEEETNSEYLVEENSTPENVFEQSMNNDSLILNDVVKCMTEFKLLTCMKILLLRRIYNVLNLMKLLNLKHEDVNFFNGLVKFKYVENENVTKKNRSTDDEETSEQYFDLDEELNGKISELMTNRTLQVSLLPGFGVEVSTSSTQENEKNEFVALNWKTFRSPDFNQTVALSQMRKSSSTKTGGIGGGGSIGNKKKKKKKKKDDDDDHGFNLMPMMVVPQMMMMGFLPFVLSNIKMMVMNAFMMNSMFLGRALMMAVKNLVFGAKGGPRVKYVNYGYKKKTKRPEIIIHSPAAFVKHPEPPKPTFEHSSGEHGHFEHVPFHNNQHDFNEEQNFQEQIPLHNFKPHQDFHHPVHEPSFHRPNFVPNPDDEFHHPVRQEFNSEEINDYDNRFNNNNHVHDGGDSFPEPSNQHHHFDDYENGDDHRIKVKRPNKIHGGFKIVRRKVVPKQSKVVRKRVNEKKIVKISGKPNREQIQAIVNQVKNVDSSLPPVNHAKDKIRTKTVLRPKKVKNQVKPVQEQFFEHEKDYEPGDYSTISEHDIKYHYPSYGDDDPAVRFPSLTHDIPVRNNHFLNRENPLNLPPFNSNENIDTSHFFNSENFGDTPPVPLTNSDFDSMRYNPYAVNHTRTRFDHSDVPNVHNNEFLHYINNREQPIVNHRLHQHHTHQHNSPSHDFSSSSTSFTTFNLDDRSEHFRQPERNNEFRNVFSSKYNKDLVNFEDRTNQNDRLRHQS